MTDRNVCWHRLDTLTGHQVHELIRLRESVFVVEQRCAYQEADAADIQAWHGLWHHDSVLVACLRVLAPDDDAQAVRIGRVLVAPAHRGHGVAHALMQAAIAFAAERWPGQSVAISAQRYLIGFYERLGFQCHGSGYLEDGIPHIAMTRQTEPPPA